MRDPIITVFNDRTIYTFFHDGRPTWLVSQIGEAGGYVDDAVSDLPGVAFVRRLIGDWRQSGLVDGFDYILLPEEVLRLALGKLTLPDPRDCGMVVHEAGMRIAVMRTRSPHGEELARVLIDAAGQLLAAAQRHAAHVVPEPLPLPLPVVVPPPRATFPVTDRALAQRLGYAQVKSFTPLAERMVARGWLLAEDVESFRDTTHRTRRAHRFTLAGALKVAKRSLAPKARIVERELAAELAPVALPAPAPPVPAPVVARPIVEKRADVAAVLADPEKAKWSDRRIADHVGVSHPFVGDVREAEGVDAAERVGVDGKVRPVETQKALPAQAREEPLPGALTSFEVEGHTFYFRTVGDQPWAKDLEFAEWLGFARPRKIRELIQRHIED